MNIFENFKQQLIVIIQKCFPGVTDYNGISVDLPRDESHGDLAINAAMVIKKFLPQNPREIAEILQAEILKLEDVQQVEIAGPGFINIRLNASVWTKLLSEILTTGQRYGDSKIGAGVKINVEYVSANPTGPLHIGHARGAIVGDALARILAKCSFDITKEYYINDAGGQVNVLAESVFIRYQNEFGASLDIPEGLYPADYLIPVAVALKEKYADSLMTMTHAERLELIKDFAVEKMMQIIRGDLHELGIHHDIFTSEKYDLLKKDKIEKGVQYLQDKGLLYKGVLEAPKGKVPEDWEPREQTLFRSTDFGDDVDRAIIKSDGSHTYFAGDIAYHIDKFERGFSEMILMLGADHSGYIKRMKALVNAISDGKANIDVILNQIVKLYKNGEPFKMSKRAGTFITVRDVLDDVGKDILRFVMLTRKSDSQFDFDLDKVKEQSKDNPVFYVQYASARANSVLRNAYEQGYSAEHASANLALLQYKEDLGLIKSLAQFPKIIEAAALAHEPHKVTYYLIELATNFHSYWAAGNENDKLRFIVDDRELSKARIALAKAVASTISAGLDVLGVRAVEQM
jgi:arginyl-tRNA synthetase